MSRQRHREHPEQQPSQRSLTAIRPAAIGKAAFRVSPIVAMPPFVVAQPDDVPHGTSADNRARCLPAYAVGHSLKAPCFPHLGREVCRDWIQMDNGGPAKGGHYLRPTTYGPTSLAVVILRLVLRREGS